MKNTGLLQNIFILLIMIPMFVLTIMILSNIDRGVDLTDEGFYLVSSMHANTNLLAVSNFSHYTRLIWLGANENIVLFRVLGVLGLLGAATYFIYSIISYLNLRAILFISPIDKALLYTTANTTVLVYYFAWLPTPSYNWLTLFSCLLLMGVILNSISSHESHKHNKIALHHIASLGLLWVVIFMSKPSSIVILGFLSILWMLSIQKRHHWLPLLAKLCFFFVLFFCLHILLFEHGLLDFLSTMKDSLEYANRFGGAASVFKVLSSSYKDIISIPFLLIENVGSSLWLIFALALTNLTVFIRGHVPKRALYWINVSGATAAILLSWWNLNELQYWAGGRHLGTKVGIGGITFFIVVFLSSLVSRFAFQRQRDLKSPFYNYSMLIISLMICAMGYSFGSGNGLLRQTSGAYVFVACATLISAMWLENQQRLKVVSFIVSGLIICSSFLVIKGAFTVPYRLVTPLAEHDHEVTFLKKGFSIKVDASNLSYIERLKELAVSNGWEEHTPFIDLTGGTPLALAILNGKPVKRAWLMGGYSGSEDAAKWLFQQVDVEIIKRAWILTAPHGSREISTSVLEVNGINFERNFEKVGELTTHYLNESQVLWRPTRVDGRLTHGHVFR